MTSARRAVHVTMSLNQQESAPAAQGCVHSPEDDREAPFRIH